MRFPAVCGWCSQQALHAAKAVLASETVKHTPAMARYCIDEAKAPPTGRRATVDAILTCSLRERRNSLVGLPGSTPSVPTTSSSSSFDTTRRPSTASASSALPHATPHQAQRHTSFVFPPTDAPTTPSEVTRRAPTAAASTAPISHHRALGSAARRGSTVAVTVFPRRRSAAVRPDGAVQLDGGLTGLSSAVPTAAPGTPAHTGRQRKDSVSSLSSAQKAVFAAASAAGCDVSALALAAVGSPHGDAGHYAHDANTPLTAQQLLREHCASLQSHRVEATVAGNTILRRAGAAELAIGAAPRGSVAEALTRPLRNLAMEMERAAVVIACPVDVDDRDGGDAGGESGGTRKERRRSAVAKLIDEDVVTTALPRSDTKLTMLQRLVVQSKLDELPRRRGPDDNAMDDDNKKCDDGDSASDASSGDGSDSDMGTLRQHDRLTVSGSDSDGSRDDDDDDDDDGPATGHARLKRQHSVVRANTNAFPYCFA